MSTSTPATVRNTFLRLRGGRLPPRTLPEIVAGLRRGDLVIFPTETVYGLGASIFVPTAMRRIYDIKGRSWRKPLALLAASLQDAAPLIKDISSEAQRLADAFWPGPLTLIFKASPLGQMIAGGNATIGVRIPDHRVTLALLRKLGAPLAATSVNRSGQKPAASAAEAKPFAKKVEWFLDGGQCRVREPSSVVDCSAYPPVVLRDGAITKKNLEKVLM